MKVFLTGASGLLGNTLALQFLEQGWQVHATSHTHRPVDPRLNLHSINLANTSEIAPLLESIQPQAIVNAAALTYPNACEKNPHLSKALNLSLPEALAQYVVEKGIRFIHFSTDLVFNGKRGNYTPKCSTNPTNLYGKHKLAAEHATQSTYSQTCIIRLPLLNGNSPSGARSVHEALWQEWKQSKVTPLFEDEWRSPISVSNVAQLTVELIGQPEIHGLFHWAGENRINRWVMGNLIAEQLDVPKYLLQKTLAANFEQFKDRPLNLTMDSSKLKALVQTKPAPFKNQLAEMTRPDK